MRASADHLWGSRQEFSSDSCLKSPEQMLTCYWSAWSFPETQGAAQRWDTALQGVFTPPASNLSLLSSQGKAGTAGATRTCHLVYLSLPKALRDPLCVCSVAALLSSVWLPFPLLLVLGPNDISTLWRCPPPIPGLSRNPQWGL